MLSNAYFLAKFRFDTAENEPAKNFAKFANFANFANPNPRSQLPFNPYAAGGSPPGTFAAQPGSPFRQQTRPVVAPPTVLFRKGQLDRDRDADIRDVLGCRFSSNNIHIFILIL